MLYCKVHEMNGTTVLACCDESVLGKNLVDEKHEVIVERGFYAGEKVDEKRLVELLREAGNINLFGDKTVGLAVQQGFLSESSVIRVGGVKHAIIFKV